MQALLPWLLFYLAPEKIAGLYTFGSPCTGNQSFAEAFNQKGLKQHCFRYVNGNDLVAKALPYWRNRFGSPEYTHVGIEKTFPFSWGFFNRSVPLNILDHAPIYYALKCWNSIPH